MNVGVLMVNRGECVDVGVLVVRWGIACGCGRGVVKVDVMCCGHGNEGLCMDVV